MIKVIYYSSATDAVTYAAQLMQDGYVCYMDQPLDETIFSSIVGVDSDSVEQANEFLFQRLAEGTDFESAIIRAVLFAHYPRLLRCLASLEQHEKAAYFAPQEKITCYDLALAGARSTEFLNLMGSETRPSDLHTLVEFYRPSGYATRLKKHLRLRFKGRCAVGAVTRKYSQSHRVLFLAHDNEVNLYLKPVVPIISELVARRIPYAVISCDSRARKFLDQEGVPQIDVEDLSAVVSPAAANDPYPMIRWFQDRIDTDIHSTGEALYDSLIRLALNSATRRDLWESRKFAQRIAEYVAREQITDAFFVPDGTPIAGELARTFAANGIRTHTMIAAGVSRFKRGVGYSFAETFYCSGSLDSSALKHHFPGRNVVTVGSPSLRRYLATPPVTTTDSRVMVLVATSGFDPRETAWMADFMATVDHGRFRLVFKPHPSHAERYEHLKTIALNGDQVVAFTEPIEGLVNAAGVIVTDHSQVGIDAHLLGKPVISMSTAKPGILYMKDIASIKYVQSVPALIQSLDEVVTNADIDSEFTAMFNAGGDSHYYKRVVDHLTNV